MLASDLAFASELTPLAFEELVKDFDPEWFALALSAVTDGPEAKLRNRKLPTSQALFLIIGMGLLRDRSIAAVAQHLHLVLPGKDGSSRISPGAIPKARLRLGSGPLEVMFALSAPAWTEPEASARRWRGLSLWAIDGTSWEVPRTTGNARALGTPTNATSVAHYPQVRAVGLLQVETHLLRALNVGGYDESEISLFRSLCKELPDNSLLLIDKGLQCRRTLLRLTETGQNRHWLTRARADLKYRLIKKLGRGDSLVELAITPDEADPSAPTTMEARLVRLERRGRRAEYLLTSCLDPEAFPAAEVRKQYVERWEIELAYDEIKNEMLESERVLRSKTPEGIRQEVYGIAIAYNLVRLQMVRAAKRAKVSPRRIGFRGAVLLVRNLLLTAWQIAPGNLPKAISRFEDDFEHLLIPARRARSYPRKLVRKRRRYATYPAHRRARRCAK